MLNSPPPQTRTQQQQKNIISRNALLLEMTTTSREKGAFSPGANGAESAALHAANSMMAVLRGGGQGVGWGGGGGGKGGGGGGMKAEIPVTAEQVRGKDGGERVSCSF